MNLHDVAMHKRSGRPGFLGKAVNRGFMLESLRTQNLDRHLPAERLLLSQINICHRTTSKPAQDAVSSQLSPGEIVVVPLRER